MDIEKLLRAAKDALDGAMEFYGVAELALHGRTSMWRWDWREKPMDSDIHNTTAL